MFPSMLHRLNWNKKKTTYISTGFGKQPSIVLSVNNVKHSQTKLKIRVRKALFSDIPAGVYSKVTFSSQNTEDHVYTSI